MDTHLCAWMGVCSSELGLGEVIAEQELKHVKVTWIGPCSWHAACHCKYAPRAQFNSLRFSTRKDTDEDDLYSRSLRAI